MIKQIVGVFLLLSLFVSVGVAAHHSRVAFFDMSQTVELEGEVTRVQWRHPHVRYWIQADSEYGGAVWEMETTPPSLLERQGIGRDILAAGTRVRVAGPPSRLAENVMEVSHVLLPDGREVLLHTGLAPRWTDNTVERANQGFDDAAVKAAEASARGIFRVWIRPGVGPEDRAPVWPRSFPLTDSARSVSAAWNPVTGIDVGCKPKALPQLMASAWPFEFTDAGNHILLRAEEFDQERVIHLIETTGEVQPSPLGYSVGLWEEGVLVVSTTHINSREFGQLGIPLSENVQVLERFSLSSDERRLDYEITVTDPMTFTAPVTTSSYWIWRPGETIKPYDCIETPGSWTDRAN